MSDGGDLEHAERIIRGIIKKYVGVDELARIIAAAEKRGRIAGLKEARSRASDYDQGPGDDTPMGPLMVAQVQTAQNIINALTARIAEIEGKDHE